MTSSLLSFALVLCIIIGLSTSFPFHSHLLDRTLSSHALFSTIVTSRANSIDPSISNSYDRNLQPSYKSNPMSSRSELMTKLTSSNKKDFSKGELELCTISHIHPFLFLLFPLSFPLLSSFSSLLPLSSVFLSPLSSSFFLFLPLSSFLLCFIAWLMVFE